MCVCVNGHTCVECTDLVDESDLLNSQTIFTSYLGQILVTPGMKTINMTLSECKICKGMRVLKYYALAHKGQHTVKL